MPVHPSFGFDLIFDDFRCESLFGIYLEWSCGDSLVVGLVRVGLWVLIRNSLDYFTGYGHLCAFGCFKGHIVCTFLVDLFLLVIVFAVFLLYLGVVYLCDGYLVAIQRRPSNSVCLGYPIRFCHLVNLL